MQKHRSRESGSQPELEEVFRWEVGSRSLIDGGLRIYDRVDEVGKEQPVSPSFGFANGLLPGRKMRTYTVDDAAKTYTVHIERCTFPQWDGIDGTNNLAFPTENELNITTTKPIPDPKMGPFVPHLNWKRASTPSNQ
jgi:hypothetical protein